MTRKTTIQIRSSKQAVSQAGVSLLMAILVLASITAISFSLASIVLTEIKSSADIVRSERALYASYAVTEEGLFRYSRNVEFKYLNEQKILNGVIIEYEESVVNPMPLIDVIAAGSPHQYNLIDSADPYGAGGYGSVRVVYSGNSGEPLRIDLYEINPTTGERVLTSSTTDPLTENGEIWENLSLNENSQYDLQLFHEGSGDSISVTIYTYDGSGGALGLPNFGLTFVDITASYLGLTRKYRTQIPVFK